VQRANSWTNAAFPLCCHCVHIMQRSCENLWGAADIESLSVCTSTVRGSTDVGHVAISSALASVRFLRWFIWP